MGCLCPNIIFILLNFLRIVGSFPYRWRWGKQGKGETKAKFEVKRSLLAVVWSWIVVLILVILSLSSVINAPYRNLDITSKVTIHLLNFASYITSAILFIYLALYSSKLAHVLYRLEEAGISLRRPLVQRKDALQLLCGVGMMGGLAYATYDTFFTSLTTPLTKARALYHIPASTCDVVIETTTLALNLTLYFLLKIISMEIRDAVNTLVPLQLPYHLPSVWVNDVPVGHSSRWGVVLHPRHSASPQKDQNPDERSPTEDYNRVSRRLLALDDVVVAVVEYAGPPAAMVLLASTVNATVMLYLTIVKLRALQFESYYVAYIITKVLSVLQVTFVPDCLCYQRAKSLRVVRELLTSRAPCMHMEVGLRDVERILSSGAKFVVCRLFTLDRHIILSVASSVVTYLVIALQFGLSENPENTHANYTAPENL